MCRIMLNKNQLKYKKNIFSIYSIEIKLFFLLALIISLPINVLASDLSVTRKIDGNKVNLFINPSDHDVITVVEIIDGAKIIVDSWNGDCNLAEKRLTCDSDGGKSNTISYQTTGLGKVTGTVYGAASNTLEANDYIFKQVKIISGDNNIPSHTIATTCTDEDLDGYCKETTNTGVEKVSGDCNDNSPLINPGMSETCNNQDDDCDGKIDNSENLCVAGLKCAFGNCVSTPKFGDFNKDGVVNYKDKVGLKLEINIILKDGFTYDNLLKVNNLLWLFREKYENSE